MYLLVCTVNTTCLCNHALSRLTSEICIFIFSNIKYIVLSLTCNIHILVIVQPCNLYTTLSLMAFIIQHFVTVKCYILIVRESYEIHNNTVIHNFVILSWLYIYFTLSNLSIKFNFVKFKKQHGVPCSAQQAKLLQHVQCRWHTLLCYEM